MKLLWGLFFVFLFVNTLDAVTSFFILSGEANPIFLFFNSIWIVIFLKGLFSGIIFYLINKRTLNNHIQLFVMILALSLGVLLLSFGAYGNIYAHFNPAVLEAASNTTPQERVEGYNLFIGIFYAFPFTMSLIAFLIYDKTHNEFIYDKKFGKIKLFGRYW